MTRTHNVDEIKVIFPCKIVEVGVNKSKTWAGAPVSEESEKMCKHCLETVRKTCLMTYLGLISSKVRSRSKNASSERKIMAMCVSKAIALPLLRFSKANTE